jgi:hypothetical protein
MVQRKDTYFYIDMAEEIVTSIVFATDHRTESDRLEYILSVEDLCNLRLVDKRTNLYVQHAFGVRFFKHRKHLLSRFGLRGLRAIARHPVFWKYVHKLSLGPEHLLPNVPDIGALFPSPPIFVGSGWNLMHTHPVPFENMDLYDKWCKRQTSRQEKFERSGKVTSLLKEALEGLTKLQVIRIRSYPRDGMDGREGYPGRNWHQPWGANTLVQEVNSVIVPNHISDPENLFCAVERPSKINWHLDPILKALEAIKDRPEWEIEFFLNSSEKYIQATAPLDIDSSSWQACKHRVRRLGIHRTIQTRNRPHSRADWLVELFRSCGQRVEELNCQNTFYWSKIVCAAPLPRLRRLKVHDATIQDLFFGLFLEKHADALESIELDNVSLSVDEYSREEYPRDVLQSDKYKRDNASWIAKFELMLRLPRLSNIHLADLSWTQSNNDEALSADFPDRGQVAYDDSRWRLTAAAQDDDVKLVLSVAIQNDVVLFRAYDLRLTHYVVFLKQSQSADDNDRSVGEARRWRRSFTIRDEPA